MNPSQLELDRARHEYMYKLRQLSSNVKDQISELTQLAQEKIFAAPAIVKLVEERIHEVRCSLLLQADQHRSCPVSPPNWLAINCSCLFPVRTCYTGTTQSEATGFLRA